jgi:7-carboxy-7-deazaguanine synthase
MKRPLVPETLFRAHEIKMPVGRARDLDVLRNEVLPHVKWGTPIWLQPLSQSEAATKLCLDEAALHDWRVSVQVHKYLGVR